MKLKSLKSLFLIILLLMSYAYLSAEKWSINTAFLNRNIDKPISYDFVVDKDKIFLFYTDGYEVKFSLSKDNGSSWNTPKSIDFKALNIGVSGSDESIISIKPVFDVGSIYLIYLTKNLANKYSLYYSFVNIKKIKNLSAINKSFSVPKKILEADNIFAYTSFSQLGSVIVVCSVDVNKESSLQTIIIQGDKISKRQTIVSGIEAFAITGAGDLFSTSVLYSFKQKKNNLLNIISSEGEAWTKPRSITAFAFNIKDISLVKGFDTSYSAFILEDNGYLIYLRKSNEKIDELIYKSKNNLEGLNTINEATGIVFFVKENNNIIRLYSDDGGVTYKKDNLYKSDDMLYGLKIVKSDFLYGISLIKIGSGYNFLLLTDNKLQVSLNDFTQYQKNDLSSIEELSIEQTYGIFMSPQSVDKGSMPYVFEMLNEPIIVYKQEKEKYNRLIFKRLKYKNLENDIDEDSTSLTGFFTAPHIYDLDSILRNGALYSVWCSDKNGSLDIYSTSITNINSKVFSIRQISFSESKSIRPVIDVYEKYNFIAYIEDDLVILKEINEKVAEYRYNFFVKPSELSIKYFNGILYIFILSKYSSFNKPVLVLKIPGADEKKIVNFNYLLGNFSHINSQVMDGKLYFTFSFKDKKTDETGVYYSIIQENSFSMPEKIVSAFKPLSKSYIFNKNKKQYLLWNDLMGKHYGIYYTGLGADVDSVYQVSLKDKSAESLFFSYANEQLYVTYTADKEIFFTRNDIFVSTPLLWSTTHVKNMVSSDNSPVFKWEIPYDSAGISGFGYVLDQNPNTVVDEKIVESVIKEASFFNLKAGKYYFHLAAQDNLGNWSKTVSYPIIINPAIIAGLSKEKKNTYLKEYTELLGNINNYREESVKEINKEKLVSTLNPAEKQLIKNTEVALSSDSKKIKTQHSGKDLVDIIEFKSKGRKRSEIDKEINSIVKDVNFKPIASLEKVTIVEMSKSGKKEVKSISFEEYKKTLKDTVGEKDTEYIVRKGDTMHEIAGKFYKNEQFFLVIAMVNKVPADHLDLIYPGDKLKIPSLDRVKDIIRSNEYITWVEKYLEDYKKRKGAR